MKDGGYISAAGEGTVFELFGGRTTLRADGADTDGAFAVIESVFPPGIGIPPHSHQSTDEAVYLLTGRLTIQVGERQVEATPGSLTIFPRGVVHAFQNASDQPATILAWMSGEHSVQMGGMLAEMSAMPQGEPDMATMVALMAQYDMTLAG
jgi:quercetin dioxygenase-like cupin family protein